jgi:integrase
VLLLTGCRLNEVVGMQRSELTDGVWTIPGTRTKNARPHTLPLPPLVQKLIAAAPAVEGGLVFSFSNRRLTGFSRVKAQLDQRMGAVTPWRLHDLRRTAASGMQRLGVRAEVIERCLNHVSGSYRGVAGIYQRDPVHDEMRKAFALWAAHVRKVVA